MVAISRKLKLSEPIRARGGRALPARGYSKQDALRDKFVRYLNNELVDENETPITQGVYTWAGKPAAAGNAGKVIEITDTIETNGVRAFFQSDNTNWNQIGEVRSTLAKIMASTVAKTIVGFRARATDFGITGRGVLYCGNGSAMVIAERQKIFAGVGKRSAPFGSITLDAYGTGLAGTLLSVSGSTNIVTFPANALPVGTTLTIEQSWWRSTGAGTATAEVFLGTAAAGAGVTNSNTKIYGFAFSGSNKFRQDNVFIDVQATNYVVSTNWAGQAATATSDSDLEGGTNISTTSTMYLQCLVKSGTLSDVWDLLFMRVYVG